MLDEQDDLRRKLQLSETKRAELVMQNHRLKDEVDDLRVSASVAASRQSASASPHRFATVGSAEGWTPGGPGVSLAGHFASPMQTGEDHSSLADRRAEALEAELREKTAQLDAAQRVIAHHQHPHQRREGTGQHEEVGFVTIAPLPQASEDDYGFAEEDHAKQCAEEIMARLLRALHTQREAQEKLAAAQLHNVRLQSLLDESRGREVVLSQMMGAYSEVVNGGGAAPGGQRPNGPNGVSAGPQQVEEYLQHCLQNLSRLDGVKRRLIDEKLKEVTEECARLKDKLAAFSASTVAAGARPISNNMIGTKQRLIGIADAITTSSSGACDIPLLSEERVFLLQLMEREKEYKSRMLTMKNMIVDKEKQVQDLKAILTSVTSANGLEKKRYQ
jgi:hypothetical protein